MLLLSYQKFNLNEEKQKKQNLRARTCEVRVPTKDFHALHFIPLGYCGRSCVKCSLEREGPAVFATILKVSVRCTEFY